MVCNEYKMPVTGSNPAVQGFVRSEFILGRPQQTGMSPNEDSVLCLIGAVLSQQIDDWQSQHRPMMF